MRLFLAIFCISMVLAGVQPARAADTHTLLANGGTGGWVNTARPLTAADFKGRPILLDFWTYGCINCMQVIPDLDHLEKKFPSLLVIGVHSAKYKGEGLSARIKQAAERFAIHHPVMNDNDYKIWDRFGVRAWPTFVLLDGEGREVSRYSGEGNRANLEHDIAQIIGTARADALTGVAAAKADTGVLAYPSHLLIANAGQSVVSDTSHHQIVKFDAGSGKVTQRIGSGVAGMKDGDAKVAQFNMPRGMVFVGEDLYVADTGNHAIRKIDAQGNVTTLAGTGKRGFDRNPDGVGTAVALASPWDLEVIEGGKALAVANAGTHQLWRYDLASGRVNVLAGSGREDIKDGDAPRAEFAQTSALSLSGDALYLVDAETSSLRVMQGGRIKTLIGTGLFDFGHVDGAYPDAMLQHPQGVFASSGKVYVADTYNNALRVYDTATAQLSTLKIDGVTLSEPGDVWVGGDAAYMTDTGNHRIVKVDLDTGKAAAIALTQ